MSHKTTILKFNSTACMKLNERNFDIPQKTTPLYKLYYNFHDTYS